MGHGVYIQPPKFCFMESYWTFDDCAQPQRQDIIAMPQLTKQSNRRFRPGLMLRSGVGYFECTLFFVSSVPGRLRLSANVTSSIKPEVHDISRRHQTKTEPRPVGNMRQNWRLIMLFHKYSRGQTRRQTDMLITILRSPTAGGRNNFFGRGRLSPVAFRRINKSLILPNVVAYTCWLPADQRLCYRTSPTKLFTVVCDTPTFNCICTQLSVVMSPLSLTVKNLTNY